MTPEYHRSVPASLKNALDVGSRPCGQSAWEGKPAAYRKPLSRRDGRLRCQPPSPAVAGLLQPATLQPPEASVGGAPSCAASWINEGTRAFTSRCLRAFES